MTKLFEVNIFHGKKLLEVNKVQEKNSSGEKLKGKSWQGKNVLNLNPRFFLFINKF